MLEALRFALAASKSNIAELEPRQIRENTIHLRYLGEIIELLEKLGNDEIVAYMERYRNAPPRKVNPNYSLWPTNVHPR